MDSDAIETDPENKTKAHFGHVFTVMSSPVRTFSHIFDAGHAWIYPFIILSVIMIFGIFLENQSFNPEAFELLPLGVNDTVNMEVIYIISLIISAIFTPVIIFVILYLIPAAIYLFFGNFVFEKNIKYRQTLNITAYSGVPFIVSSLVGSLLIGIGGDTSFSFSPAVFLPLEIQQTFLGMWLGIFNLFSLWQVFLTIVGLSVLFQQTRLKVAAWLIPLYLVVFTFAVMILSFMRKFASDLGAV